VRRSLLLLAAVLLAALAGRPAAAADLVLPPGFTAQPYVTGEGFDGGTDRAAAGFPAAASVGVDGAGYLYLARAGARFRTGEAEDWSAVYRFPPGGVRLARDSEPRYFFGPPLRNPVVAAIGPAAELYVTTYDRDRRLGALYRVTDGRPALFAGGTPPEGGSPLLRQPEGAAVDAAGHVYVADRERGAVVRLDAAGRVLAAEHVRLTRPRMLAVDGEGRLWVAGDGSAETPFQAGAGQLWRVEPDGTPALVLEGPLPAGLAAAPGGGVFLAQRRANRVWLVTPDGRQVEFGSGADGVFLRGLAFAPVTPATRRAGLAGDLLVILSRRRAWMLNEVWRVSGPFEEFVRQHR
jgi:hypothetical protein